MPGFDPNEPRDEQGRWTVGGGQMAEAIGTAIPIRLHGSENAASAIRSAASDNRGPVKLDYVPNEHLSPEQQQIQEKFKNDLEENFYARQDYYLENLAGQYHNVISADEAKELSPDYQKNRAGLASAVHEPASAFVKKVYENLLAKPKQGPGSFVLFTAGGTGAGKTSGTSQFANLQAMAASADIVFDSNLSGYAGSLKKINQALESGRNANVIYVYRDISDAFENGVVPRSTKHGRTVPITEHIRTHTESLETAAKLTDHYSNENKVNFYFLDNKFDKGNAKIATINELLSGNKGLDKHELSNKLNEYVDRQFKSGKITAEQHAGFRTKTGSAGTL